MQSCVRNITTAHYLGHRAYMYSSGVQTSTELTATKLFSRNREGTFHQFVVTRHA